MNESIIYVSLCVLFRQWMNKWTLWASTRTLLEKKRNYLLQHTTQIQFASKTLTQIHYSELKEKKGKSSEVAYGARGGSRVLTTCWEEYPNEVHGSRGRPRHKLLKKKLKQSSAAQHLVQSAWKKSPRSHYSELKEIGGKNFRSIVRGGGEDVALFFLAENARSTSLDDIDHYVQEKAIIHIMIG